MARGAVRGQVPCAVFGERTDGWIGRSCGTLIRVGAGRFGRQQDGAMADKAVPHFHNQPGVRLVAVGSKEFMCIGALPPFDHPHVFLDMGADTEIICQYCSTLFRYDPRLKPGAAEPASCVWAEDGAAKSPKAA